MPQFLSSRIPLEFSAGNPELERPGQFSRSGRAIAPSYATRSQTITLSQPVAVPLAVPALAANANATLTGSMLLSTMTSVVVGPNDLARVLFTNVSVPTIAGAITSAPQLTLVTAQGNFVTGELVPNMTYTNLTLQVALTIFAAAALTAQTLTVTAHAQLVGEALGN